MTDETFCASGALHLDDPSGELVATMRHAAADDPLVVAGILLDGFAEIRAGSRSSTVESNVWVLVSAANDPVPPQVTAVRADATVQL